MLAEYSREPLRSRSPSRLPEAVFAVLVRVPGFEGVSPQEVVWRKLSCALTNSSYRVEVGRETLLIRIPGAGTGAYIDRLAEGHNTRVASALGLSPEVLLLEPSEGTMVCRFVEGRSIDAARLRTEPRLLADAVLALLSIHTSRKVFASRFDPFEKLGLYLRLLRVRGAELPKDLEQTLQQMLEYRTRLRIPASGLAPCHNDPWPANFLEPGTGDARRGLYLVDWEYSGMNDPAWDLADLFVEADLNSASEPGMIRVYLGAAPDVRETAGISSRIQLYKPVCDFFWAVWALLKYSYGATDAEPEDAIEDYLSYSHNRYEQCKARMRYLKGNDALRGHAG